MTTDVPVSHALRGLALMLFSCGLIWCHACAGSEMHTARMVIAGSARTAVAIDRVVSPAFAAASGAAASDPDTLRRYNIVVTSLLLARMAILDAEVALDAIEAGREGNVGDVIACVVEAVQNLVRLLPTLDVEIPDAVAQIMALASAFSGTCGADHEIDVSSLPAMSEVVSVTP